MTRDHQQADNRTRKNLIYITLFLTLFFAFSLSRLPDRSAVSAQQSNSQQNNGGISANTAINNCSIFPADNPWNTDISNFPVHPNSANFIAYINNGNNPGLHPDFGTIFNGLPIGIPFNIVSGTQPKVNVSFDFADESDLGPYPIPTNPLVEGLPVGTQVGPNNCNGDCHLIMLDKDNCILYELYAVSRDTSGNWHAGSGAIYNLNTNDMRPDGYTSADAAGLSILPGLARYDEFAGGVIDHAFRFTVQRTQRAYIHPATHYASSITDPNAPPMGLRLRLKANYDISTFDPKVQVILRALKKYGMIVADNGSNYYISGAPDSRWDDDLLSAISRVKGNDFEVVYTGDPITSNPPSPGPKISTLSPVSAPVNSNVIISGENLQGTTSVKFNGTNATFTQTGTNIIMAKVPTGASSGLVTLSNPDGNATSPVSFTVVKIPAITTFTPTSGAVGTSVTINGSNLDETTSVKFNGVATSFNVISATSLSAAVPAGATSGKISIINPGASTTSTATFTVLPKITSFTPASGITGTQITITGTSFTGATAVKINNVLAASFTVNSDTQITATVAATATTGTITVTVPGATATSATSFTVIKPPTLSSFSPTSGGLGTLITINGTNFGGITNVQFNGTDAPGFTLVSATQLKASVPAGATSGKISVVNVAGTATSVGNFTVIPKITGFTPASGLAGSSVIINGSKFTGATSVKFGAVVATFTVNSDSQITATVPATAVTGTISVVAPGATAVSATSFIVIKPPTVSSFSPASGGVGALITISGSNFNGSTNVQFNGIDAVGFTIVSNTQLKANVPVGASTGKVSVVNPAGSATSVGVFKVLPKIASFTPASGPAGTSVTITGSNFTGATSVKFGTAVAVFTVDSDSQITATVPATASTGTISVVTPGGTGLSATTFVVIKKPVVSTFTPASAKVGAIITISGANFAGITDVKFNNTSAVTVTVVSAAQIKATVPVGATTGKITVTNAAGSTASTATFTVLP